MQNIILSRSLHRLLAGAYMLAGAGLAPTLGAQTSYFFDFEDFNDGTIVGQHGWTPGSDPALLSGTVEQITGNVSFSGNKSWQYTHGITNGLSLGPGTPFSPNLAYGLSQVGNIFSGSIMFKPVVANDDSWLELDTGNPAGDDRAEFIAYINNYSSGLSVTSFILDSGNLVEVEVAAGLDANSWHQLDFRVIRTGLESNSVDISVDGSGFTSYVGSLALYRQDNMFAYDDSLRLKFVASPSPNGFYIDNVAYAVPEPASSAALVGAAALGLLVWRRRR